MGIMLVGPWAGLGELRREQYDRTNMDLMILHQDWIVAIDPDTIEEVAIGPFYSANAKRNFEEKLPGFMGAAVLMLQKPE
jgi:hypothetical protein